MYDGSYGHAPCVEPTLDEVKNKFETWRRDKKGRKSIPPKLWDSAVSLSKKYSINKISRILQLNYTALKQRVQANNIIGPPAELPAPDFIELNFNNPFVSSEYLIEMGRGG